ncbi:MAG TPA: response regulator [Verrucomicrobiae bacterium]|nr:response regulator [Verrucomicrobiae bacterium]
MKAAEAKLILLVENREADVLLVKSAFEKTGVDASVFVVRDGEAAIAYLQGEGKFSGRAEYPLPFLILLDLETRRVDGIGVLEWIRQQPGSIRGLPVVVLTGSNRLADVNAAYQAGANSFLVKPHEFEDYIALTRLIHRYWAEMAQVPEAFRPARGRQPGMDS